MLRIHADFNGLVRGPMDPDRIAVVLDTYGSLKDLCNAGVVLRPGLELIAFDHSDDHEDLEIHGVACFDATRGWWVVQADEQGVRYVPATPSTGSAAFLCVACRRVVPEMTPPSGVFSAVCSGCGTPVVAALAPPPKA